MFGSFADKLVSPVEPLGNTVRICSSSPHHHFEPSANCCWRSFCCSFQCVWAADSVATVVCTAVIVVLCAVFGYIWMDEAVVIGEVAFWSSSHPVSFSTEEQCLLLNAFRKSVDTHWYIAIGGQIIFFTTTLFFLWSTTLSNPGILTKQTGVQSVAPDGNLTQVENVNGVLVYRPFCPTCNIIRPVRASHCSQCNNCVERFDHHCGVIGACIGRRNFHLFFLFLISVALQALWTAGWSIVSAVAVFHCDSIKFALNVILVIISAALGLQITAMVGYYVPLIGKNKTKREDVKMDRLYHRALNPDVFPFDQGSCNENWKAMLCTSSEEFTVSVS